MSDPNDSNLSNPNTVAPLDLALSSIADPVAWAIVEEYAAGIIDTFPDVKEKLTEYLGVKYKYEDWQEAFKAINHTEDDAAATITVIKALQSKALDASNSKSTSFALPPNISSIQAPLSHTQHPPLNQLAALENELMEQVHKLQKRKCMQGTALTLEEMLNPIEEDVIDDGCNFPRRASGKQKFP